MKQVSNYKKKTVSRSCSNVFLQMVICSTDIAIKTTWLLQFHNINDYQIYVYTTVGSVYRSLGAYQFFNTYYLRIMDYYYYWSELFTLFGYYSSLFPFTCLYIVRFYYGSWHDLFIIGVRKLVVGSIVEMYFHACVLKWFPTFCLVIYIILERFLFSFTSFDNVFLLWGVILSCSFIVDSYFSISHVVFQNNMNS